MKIEVTLAREDEIYWEASAKEVSPSCFAFGINQQMALQNLLETLLMELALKAGNGRLPFEDGMTIQVVVRPSPK